MKLNFKKFCLAFKPKINFTFTKMKDYLIFFLVFVYVCKYRGAQFVGISEYFLIANFLQTICSAAVGFSWSTVIGFDVSYAFCSCTKLAGDVQLIIFFKIL